MALLSILKEVSETALDFLFPPQCVVCNTAGAYFCATCQQKLTYINPPFCDKCGYPIDNDKTTCTQCQRHPLEHITAIRSVTLFTEDPLRTAIHKFKYQNHKVLGKTLAPLLARCYTINQLSVDVIVPVPLHKSRYKDRGYNQSTELAKELSKLIYLPIDNTTLVRQRKTKPQMSLKASERKANVAHAFACTANTLAGKTVLLIDDVCTTGATLDACADALKQADVHAVHALTLSRAV